MSRAAHFARLVDRDRQRLGVVDVQLQRNLLQVEDDVGRVLDHARNRRELVEHAVDLDRGDRRAFNRGEQHAPQRVADRRAEAALERLRVEAAEPVGERLALELEPLGSLKTFPEHRACPFANGPADGPPDLQVTADLPPQVCVRLRAGGCEVELNWKVELEIPSLSSSLTSAYFEYSSTISCSCTGRLICSRVGIEMMRPVIVFGVERQPLGNAAALHFFHRVLDRRVLLRAAEHGDRRRLRLHRVRRDVDLLAVDQEVAVAHQLPRLRPRRRQAEPVDHVVEPPLEQLQQRHAGDAARPLGRLEVARGTDPRARRRCA